MKLEPDPPIASFRQTEPLWCYIEHTLSEYAIQSPTDRLTPAVSTNTLLHHSVSFWVFTHDTHTKSNPTRATHPQLQYPNDSLPNYAAAVQIL